MRLEENIHLAGHTTFRLGGVARYFVEARTEADVQKAFAWAGEHKVPLFVLGGGSNLLVPDEGFPGLVLRIAIAGVKQDGCRFEVGAGEPWDPLVSRTVAAGCAGMECLAGIPGSTGGTPVQNVGAYGQEVSETIASVRVFDRSLGLFADLPHEACRFRYRASLFNTDEPGRYIVTRVTFTLRSGGEPTLRYADLQRYFAGRSSPTLAEVAEAVRGIRRAKGMVLVEGDPDTHSAGSYFKNPADCFRAADADCRRGQGGRGGGAALPSERGEGEAFGCLVDGAGGVRQGVSVGDGGVVDAACAGGD